MAPRARSPVGCSNPSGFEPNVTPTSSRPTPTESPPKPSSFRVSSARTGVLRVVCVLVLEQHQCGNAIDDATLIKFQGPRLSTTVHWRLRACWFGNLFLSPHDDDDDGDTNQQHQTIAPTGSKQPTERVNESSQRPFVRSFVRSFVGFQSFEVQTKFKLQRTNEQSFDVETGNFHPNLPKRRFHRFHRFH